METVSFDVWGTLLKSNPKFKEAQIRLVEKFTGIKDSTFLLDKAKLKKEIDQEVELNGTQPNRYENYKKLLPMLSLIELNQFIKYSDRLFLKYPPIVIERGRSLLNMYSKKYNILISSNTVFIYGDILSKVIFDEFEIPICNCNFSDVLGVSKPNGNMFKFKVKPICHIGDNEITDGSCINEGINFININDASI